MPAPKLIGTREETITKSRIFLLISELFEDICQQVLGGLILRLGLNQLVHDLLGQQILAFVVQLPPSGDDFLCTTHHLNIERRRVAWR